MKGNSEFKCDRNTVSSDESARRKHFLSVYTGEEKEWLVETGKEETGRGRRFMKRIKENNMSTQNPRYNAGRFRLE